MRLTYGFELEGAFSQELIDELTERDTPAGDFKTDGSVSFMVSDVNFDVGEHDGCTSEEFASKIFNDHRLMLRLMEKFDESSHYWNKSCGLHLHIGVKREQGENVDNFIYRQRYGKFWGVMCNIEFVKRLYEQALTFCECQKNRLTTREWADRYFKMPHNRTELIRHFRSREKYAFMHFHDQGTVEFRFISPCKHKVENVNKVINFVHEYLAMPLAEASRFRVDATADTGDYNFNNQLPKDEPESLVFKSKYRAERHRLEFKFNPIAEDVEAFKLRCKRIPEQIFERRSFDRNIRGVEFDDTINEERPF